MILRFKFLLFICALCLTNITYAQLETHLISGEGWAKGDYVEIGINAKGVYGASTYNKPASFHDNRESDINNLFGFIANPLADGWVDYDGDFFTPGDPEEGFCVSINGINYNNNNNSSLFQIPGEVKGVNVISSDCFDDTAQIFWEGNVDGLNIKRYYSVTKDGLFIQMSTTIKNISNVVKPSVFFMHNVDPDNNVTLSGEHSTDIEIVSQASSAVDNISLVTASQAPLLIPEDMDGSNVSFFCKDELARVSFGGFNNRSATEIWNGMTFSGAEGDLTLDEDVAISIAFNLGDIAPNEAKKFTYYYILKEIEESFIPLIVNIFKENPSICDGTDGKIIFSGLTAGESYVISYKDDGVLIPSQTFIADTLGDIEISNLDSGIYSDVTINFAGCDTNINTLFELSDPVPPNFNLTHVDLSNCASFDAQINIQNLTPYTNYLVSYTLDNTTLYGPEEYTANFNGEINLLNLDRGIYSDFILEQYGCYTASNQIVEVLGPAIPTAYSIPPQFYCDQDYDYVTSIDLSSNNTFILGPDNPLDYQITYHLTEQDAINGVNLNTTAYTTSGLNSFTLYAKKTDLSHFCYSYIPFTVTINLPPAFSVDDAIICVNIDDTVNTDYSPAVLSTNLSSVNYTFEWYFEGNLIPGESGSYLIANNYGLYAVTATSLATQCSYTNQANVFPSGPPKTLEVEIISEPFSENHTIEIITTGHGDYVYNIDNQTNQSSPIFTDISAGHHSFTITDFNGCGQVTIDKTLIDYMHFFTPNNDGHNDNWQIIGVEKLIQPKIYIFNRHGKFLTTVNPKGLGWDGKYNGTLLPASDYWFKVIFLDQDNIEREFKSHFTLRR